MTIETEKTVKTRVAKAEIIDVIETIIAHRRAANAAVIDKDIKSFIASVQGRDGDNPLLNHPRLSFFCAHYGALANELSLKQCRQTIDAIIAGNHLYNDWAGAVDADLRLFELSMGGRDLIMTPQMRAHAVSFGMMVAEQGIDIHAMGAVGAGYESDYDCALAMDTKEGALDFIFDQAGDDICAMAGMIFANGLGQTPLFIFDQAGLMACHLAWAIDPILVTHCVFVGAVSCERQDVLKSMNLMTLNSDKEELQGEGLMTLWASFIDKDLITKH